MSDDGLLDATFQCSPHVRYAAVATASTLETRSREQLINASDGTSDRYEELLVNPTVLMLTQRRGDVDCGGLRYVIVRYGHFWQILIARASGHVSVALELNADPTEVAECLLAVAARFP